MASQIVVIVYLVIGCGAAIATLGQKSSEGRLSGAPGAMLMFFLWPFLLPTAFLREPTIWTSNYGGDDERSRRIGRAAQAMNAAWAKSDATEDRERAVVEGFVDKLRKKQEQLRELEEAIPSVSPSIRPKLNHLREKTSKEIETGLGLLEEMTAQLTLLRFSGIAENDEHGADRDRVEDLLARIEAMADLEKAA